DFSKYKIVVLPAYNISSESDAVRLEEFVKGGGTVVVTFRSGNRDEYNKINGLTIPGYFKEICGINVINYDAVGSNRRGITGITGLLNADTWCDLIDQKDSIVIAEYNDGFYKGSPCITKNQYRNGAVYYIGTHLDRDGYNGFFDYISAHADVRRCPIGPVSGVETVTWEDSGNTCVFVMNHLNTAVYVPLDRDYTEMIMDKKVSSTLRLEPYGVAVLQ
ncbi:MAG: beta-galactosidase trimerization domain-containing protein, partial [Clostridia bacterium]|nr:beta-galactosidase trimerization domain-containing protein [Clostridia bacterium]